MALKKGLSLGLVFAVVLVVLTPLSALALQEEPPAAAPEPLFTPQGPDGVPGVWIWLSGEETWSFVPAQARVSTLGLATPSSGPPPWPSDVTKFWMQPAQEPGSYWVWDVFAFADAEDGPSVWAPRWRLVSGSTPLGL